MVPFGLVLLTPIQVWLGREAQISNVSSGNCLTRPLQRRQAIARVRRHSEALPVLPFRIARKYIFLRPDARTIANKLYLLRQASPGNDAKPRVAPKGVAEPKIGLWTWR